MKKNRGLGDVLETAVEYDGWLLTHVSDEVVEVVPNNVSNMDLRVKILFCERYAKQFNKKLNFKMVLNQVPEQLDAILKTEGYQIGDSGFVLIKKDLIDIESECWNGDVHIYEKGDGRFNELLTSLFLEGIEVGRSACFCEVFCEGVSAGVAFATIQFGKMGIFNVFVKENFRGKGIGEQLICRLFTWGMISGADSAYLHVLKSNPIAVGLYQKLGFVKGSKIWKRIQP
ncbi:MAG: GNAT family N-acetyltransferase [Clostridia bacterium]|nr:GNAT family N-acetyltransferase [Clostridia bacterium]